MRRLLAAGVLLAVLLAVSTQAGAATPQPNKVKQTARPIETLAMDGPRVAYASGGRVRIWNVATGATSVVTGSYGKASNGCGCGGNATASEIAIAGKRVAWIKTVGFGNTELDHWLYTAPLGGSAHLLRRALGYNNTDCGVGGPQIDGLVGSGTFLAVSTWKFNDNGSASSNKRLNLITPTGLRAIATGPNAVISASADAGHIAVVPLAPVSMDPGYCVSIPASSVSIYVYSTQGPLLNKIAVSTPNSGVFGVAISGHRLVVLTAARTLEVYDWTTGSLLHTWPVATRDPRNLGLYGQFAIVGSSRLHVLDVTTGTDVTIAPAGPRAIGPRGLVYAVSTRNTGKLVFVPMARLLALVS